MAPPTYAVLPAALFDALSTPVPASAYAHFSHSVISLPAFRLFLWLYLYFCDFPVLFPASGLSAHSSAAN